MKTNKILSILLAIILLFVSLTIPATAQQDIKVLLNGTQLVFDVPPQIINDRTMVPMRVIFEALGADVYWDDWSAADGPKIITAVKNEIKIFMAIDEYELIKFIGYDVDKFIYEIENDELQLVSFDVPPQVIDSRTLIPLRAISEALGVNVEWDGNASTVTLTCDNEFIESKNTDKTFHDKYVNWINTILDENKITEITVSTAEEFINALGSNTKILLEPGVYNLSSVKQGYSSNKQVYWEKQYDGNELHINGISNLIIEGIGDEPSEIIIEPRYAYVLCFNNSANIKISNIKAGHTDAGTCMGGVFSFTDCYDIKIDNTYMYGCGTEGLGINGVKNMQAKNSSIYECTYRSMSVENSINISFDNCIFRNNESFGLILIYSTSNFIIDNSEFRENNAKSGYSDDYMFYVSSSENITVKNTKFINNTAKGLGGAGMIDFENNIFTDNKFEDNTGVQ